MIKILIVKNWDGKSFNYSMEKPSGTERGKSINGCAVPSLDGIRRSVVEYLGHENFVMEVGALQSLANVRVVAPAISSSD